MSVKNNSTITEKIQQLDTMVAWFDSDEFVLEQAIDRFKQAEKLAIEIEKELTTMQNDVKILKERFDQAV